MRTHACCRPSATWSSSSLAPPRPLTKPSACSSRAMPPGRSARPRRGSSTLRGRTRSLASTALLMRPKFAGLTTSSACCGTLISIQRPKRRREGRAPCSDVLPPRGRFWATSRAASSTTCRTSSTSCTSCTSSRAPSPTVMRSNGARHRASAVRCTLLRICTTMPRATQRRWTASAHRRSRPTRTDRLSGTGGPPSTAATSTHMT
mmetsp:Transcript_42460/g.99444  ORF Transcript_42460/g.99444 Transcript_42460/m.99444 type:complete len:205 (-) Transcript_42460:654-1268(-)